MNSLSLDLASQSRPFRVQFVEGASRTEIFFIAVGGRGPYVHLASLYSAAENSFNTNMKTKVPLSEPSLLLA